MAKLTNTTIYGAANITGNVVSTGPVFDISAASGINLSSGNSISSVILANTGLNYQTVPNVTFANTTTGGVTAYGNVLMKISSTFSVGNVGSGYVNGDFLYANTTNFATSPVLANAVFQVTSNTATTYGTGGINGLSLVNSGLFFTMPPYMNSSGVLNTGNPQWLQISGTSGTGVGANVDISSAGAGGVQVSNVYFQTTGSGYVEQPTVTFSGGTPITQATGYVTVGSVTTIKTLGSTLSFTVPNQQTAFQVVDYPGSTTSGYWSVWGGNANPQLRATGSGSGAILTAGPQPLAFFTNGGTQQFNIQHTASAVNYIQATGGATGNPGSVTLSAQGSDTNINFIFQRKGSGQFQFSGATWVGINSVNYLTLNGNISGSGPTISVGSGTDANIDINLLTKGTGSVNVANSNIIQNNVSTNRTIIRNQTKGAFANLDNISVTVNTAGFPLVSTVSGTQAVFWSWERLGGTLTGGSYTGSTLSTTQVPIGLGSALGSGGDTAIVNLYEQNGVNFYRITCTQMVTSANASIIIERIA